MTEAENFDKGGGLFVQRDDGHWVYRNDEISELYALAMYQLVRTGLEHPRKDPDEPLDRRFWREVEDGALKLLCTAIEARPDVVRKHAQEDQPLPPRTQRLVERAQRKCVIKGGWRSKSTERPDLGSWNDPID
jgi:hypothetical protein